jgi:hypothetical protein
MKHITKFEGFLNEMFAIRKDPPTPAEKAEIEKDIANVAQNYEYLKTIYISTWKNGKRELQQLPPFPDHLRF